MGWCNGADEVCCREHWQSGPENQQRGRDWLAQIYRHNDTKTAEMMAAHKDLRTLPSPLATRFIN